MKIDDRIREVMQQISNGLLDRHAGLMDGQDFGFYIPSYMDGDEVKLMEPGQSQTETNLKVSLLPIDAPLGDAKVVGWIGDPAANDSSCRHGGSSSCSHGGRCRHCSSHTADHMGHLINPGSPLDAPGLDYDATAQRISDFGDVLKDLAPAKIGLTLLHGHNDKHEFTKLPDGIVSVISNGRTVFVPQEEVDADPDFVPNSWRFVDGQLKVAGGFTAKEY